MRDERGGRVRQGGELGFGQREDVRWQGGLGLREGAEVHAAGVRAHAAQRRDDRALARGQRVGFVVGRVRVAGGVAVCPGMGLRGGVLYFDEDLVEEGGEVGDQYSCMRSTFSCCCSGEVWSSRLTMTGRLLGELAWYWEMCTGFLTSW